ncbi:short-chain dehydrogenase/reductase SDR [Leptodontidium sp. 2 PMI_412]|nr:short-chain dehydrogenase/reductase SDR [Leptodontidium sp. MPI-SDFR-AT-0119]KAH9206750.1 short-chain dehydrogenase/reductase SDR [Leptodontidium sp. 2 PMI_412]
MARILITGSSDGLGHNLAKSLIAQGHAVTLHARSAERAKETVSKTPGAAGILVADLSSIAETKKLALEANEIGVFDAVVHNAGVGYGQAFRRTEDGIAQLFAVNALAPYILTALMERPNRLVYVSSSLHRGGNESMVDVGWKEKKWDGFQAYGDSKLMDLILALGVARHWPEVSSNALDPGWVKTKMGGSSAPDSLKKSNDMLVWLATGDPKDIGSGKYYAAQGGKGGQHPVASDQGLQEEFLRVCEEISGVKFPK